MNMLRLPVIEGGFSILEGWCKGCSVGLVLAFDAAIAGSLVLWCTHLADATVVGADILVGLFLVHREEAALALPLEAMM